MSLKEALWGTPREIQADKRYGELSRISQKRRLNPIQQAELEETKGFSRRLFLKRGATVLGVVTIAASPVGGYLITHPELFQSHEDRFFDEIDQLSTGEQIRKIDEYYSRNKLSVETARARVLPVWARNYIESSGSGLTSEQILANTILFTQYNRTEELAKVPFGKVETDPRSDYKGPIQVNFSAFESNRIYPSNNNPPTSGIVLYRTELTHEMVHWDVQFRHTSTLGSIINDHAVYTPPLDFADNTFVDGFAFYTVEPDSTGHTFFANLDEIAADVSMSIILDKGGHRHVFGFPKARVMKDFLTWIGLSKDKFIQYHRNSDLEGVAKDIGELSVKATKRTPSSEADIIATGLKVLKIFHNGNADDLEVFFPGTNRAIFGQR